MPLGGGELATPRGVDAVPRHVSHHSPSTMPSIARAFRAAVLAHVALSFAAQLAHAQTCSDPARVVHLGGASPGFGGVPRLDVEGSPIVGRPLKLRVRDARPGSVAVFAAGASGPALPLPAFGATQYVGAPFSASKVVVLDSAGSSTTPVLATGAVDPSLCGASFAAQALVVDADAAGGLAFTAGLELHIGAASTNALLPSAFVDVPDEVVDVRSLDLDGDGSLDLIGLADGEDPAIVVSKGLGALEFAEPVRYSVGAGPKELAIGDFDGDGQLDIAACCSEADAIFVAHGTGGTNFAVAPPVAVPEEPFSIAAGDFDADGRTDLAIASDEAQVATILLGLAGGGFATGPALAVGEYPRVVRVADLDADGDLDVAVLYLDALSGALRLWRGVGDGTFASPKTLTTAEYCVSLAIGDLDGDGILDLAAGHGIDSKLTVLFGVGNMSYAIGQFHDCGVAAKALAIADVTGDGTGDVLAIGEPEGSGQSRVAFVATDASGAIEPPVEIGVGLGGDALHVVDLNGDGALDLVAPNPSRDAIVHEFGDGAGGFAPPFEVVDLAVARPGFASADFDGDGFLDAAFGPVTPWTAAARIAIVRGGEDLGALDTVTTILTGTSAAQMVGLATGDLDQDGAPDLVAIVDIAGIAPEAYVLLGVGDGMFTIDSIHALTQFKSLGVVLEDVDADGDLDIVTVDERGTFDSRAATCLNLGAGQFAPAVIHDTGTVAKGFASGDFDGDGRCDLVLLGSNAGTAVVRRLSSVGDGTFVAADLVDAGVSGVGPNGGRAVAVGHVDPDAALDLVVAGREDGAIAILRGNGSGGFGPPLIVAAAGEPDQVRLVDVDGDAKLDVVALDDDSGRVVVLRSSGGPIFGAASSYAAGGRADGHAVVDLDGDGAPEVLAWSAGATAGVRVLANGLYE